MASQQFEYVVLGAGNAGGYIAKSFVDKAGGELPPSQLALVTDEAVGPYERPALSKGFLLGKAALPGFHTCAGVGGAKQDPEWYKTHNISLLTGTQIVNADAGSKTVTAADGSTITATKGLIVATGCDTIRLTRSPGHDLEGIHYLRNHADGLGLVEGLKGASHCVMVGGGYIGMEVAAAMVTLGLKVTMVFPDAHLMPRLFTPEMAAFYEDVYKAKGVTFVTASCSEFVGAEGKVTGIKLDNGEVVNGDLVCVGVGARPVVSLFEGQLAMADRSIGGGIKVNGKFETSVPGVYAIGDIASFPLTKYGRDVRMEHVTHARQSAAHCVAAITDSATPDYDYLPHFYSRVFDMSWKFWGDAAGTLCLLREEKLMLGVWVSEGKAVGVFLEGGSDEQNALIKAAAERQVSVAEGALSGVSVSAALALLA